MNAVDRKKFIEVVVGFAELKSRQLSAPALELYWRSLQHWPLADFLTAAEQLVRTAEFMPTPKDFEDLRRAGRPTAGEGWFKALELARNAWPSQLPTATCGDLIVDRVVRMVGGYQAIAASSSESLQFLERRFAEHWATYQEAEDTRDAVPQLVKFGRALSGPRRASDLLGAPDDDAA